jgi:hypothetical protein
MIWSIFTLLSTAFATGIHSSDALCPIDETDSVKLYFLISGNEFGGYDSDGATYSSGTQYREHAISTCQRTLFSAYTEDMQRSFSSTEIASIQEWLPNVAAPISTPTVWERYDLAAEYYRWKQKPALFMGKLYLEAAWTVRDQAVGIHPNLNGPIVADEVLERGVLELQKDLTTEQRKMVIYNLARVAHRNARFQTRDLYIAQFLADPDVSSDEKKAAQEFIFLTQTVEPVYLKKALTEYLLHSQQAPNDGQTLYLIADLHRRLNNPEQAKIYFERANRTAHLQPEQRLIIEHLLNTL